MPLEFTQEDSEFTSNTENFEVLKIKGSAEVVVGCIYVLEFCYKFSVGTLGNRMRLL